MAILSHSRLSRLLTAIYSAAEDPSKWDDFLAMLATDLAGAAPVIVTVDGASPVCNVVAFSNLDPEVVKQYDQYWGREDIYAESGHPLTRTEGAAFPSHAVVPQQIAHRTRFVNEYQIPNGMGHNITGVVAARPSLWAVLSCNFPIKRRMPSEDKIDLVRLLVPHLRRAVYLHQQLQGLTLNETAMSEVVDELPVGLVLVGEDGCTVRLNREAERIFSESDGIGHSDRRMRLWDCVSNQRLQQLIHEATGTTSGGQLSHGGVLSVPRPSGRKAYSVMVTPVGTQGILFNQHRAHAVSLIADPERRLATDTTRIQKMFGLTSTEARVAAALALGLTSDEIQSEFRVSRNTLQTHLRRVYDKTGSSGQVDLTRLLLRSLAMLLERKSGNI